MANRKHLPAEERRELTIRTVLDLCSRGNPSRVTMASIADAMRVTQGALFRHFRGKDDIWCAVIDWAAKRLMRRVDRAVEQATTPGEALRALFMTHVVFITEHPGVPRMLMGELQHPEPTPARRIARSLLEAYRQRVSAVLSEGRDGGEFAPDLDVDAAAVQFIGTIQGMVLQSLMVGDVSRIRGQAPRLLELYMRGIGAARRGHD